MTFVCTSCSGLLRGLNPSHRIKAISMAKWTADEVAELDQKGNKNNQGKWLANWNDSSDEVPDKDKNPKGYARFLERKYDGKWKARAGGGGGGGGSSAIAAGGDPQRGTTPEWFCKHNGCNYMKNRLDDVFCGECGQRHVNIGGAAAPRSVPPTSDPFGADPFGQKQTPSVITAAGEKPILSAAQQAAAQQALFSADFSSLGGASAWGGAAPAHAAVAAAAAAPPPMYCASSADNSAGEPK